MRDIQVVGNQILEHVSVATIRDWIRGVLYEATNGVLENQNRAMIDGLLQDASDKLTENQDSGWRELHAILLYYYKTPFTSNEALEVFSIFEGVSKDELLNQK